MRTFTSSIIKAAHLIDAQETALDDFQNDKANATRNLNIVAGMTVGLLDKLSQSHGLMTKEQFMLQAMSARKALQRERARKARERVKKTLLDELDREMAQHMIAH